MKRIFLLLTALLLSYAAASADSYDERIARAMNTGDWFELDSIYNVAPKDSVMPFLEVFSRGLIGNRLNRPNVSIPAFAELLNEHSAYLDISNLLSSSMMFATDLSLVGENAQAASLLTSVYDAAKEHLDSTWTTAMRNSISLYSALSAYRPYTISFDSETGRIPFRIAPVGKPEKQTVLMYLTDSSINGIETAITFDTGAGVNIISDSLARHLGLIYLDSGRTVKGIGTRETRCAIAKELRIGNITVSDVPFLVTDMATGNDEADQYIDCFSIVVGSELMLHLKDLTVDFIAREITVPSVAPARSGTPANMCMSSSRNIVTKGRIHGDPMMICIDTGDASYGSLNGDFFAAHRDYVMTNARTDTVRMAGIGGVDIRECFILPDVNASIGGNTTMLPEIVVNTDANPLAADYICNFGLKSLMLFGKVRFNMVDFILTTMPSPATALTNTGHTAPSFKVTPEKGVSPLQAAGLIAVGVARGLINPNAPDNPDL